METPKHNIESEIAVLGAMLIDKQAISTASLLLQKESFFIEKNQILFKVITDLFASGIDVDILTVVNEIIKQNKIDLVTPIYITEINGNTPSSANVYNHALIVKEKYLLRQIRKIGLQAEKLSNTNEPLKALSQLEKSLYSINTELQTTTTASIQKLTKEAYERHTNLLESPKQVTGIKTGIPKLDKVTHGFQNGNLIILGARPSVGKTTLAINITLEAAKKYNVAFFSVEVTNQEIIDKCLSLESGINSDNLKSGFFKDKVNNYEDACDVINKLSITVDDQSGISPLELRSKLVKMNSLKKIELIVIDYIGIMQILNAQSREREIGMISLALKSIAKEFKCPVLVLAQLNRLIEGRQETKPKLSDLRDSGSLEQDADLVMFLYREDGHHKLNLAKHRNGGLCTIDMNLNYPTGKFTEILDREQRPF